MTLLARIARKRYYVLFALLLVPSLPTIPALYSALARPRAQAYDTSLPVSKTLTRATSTAARAECATQCKRWRWNKPACEEMDTPTPGSHSCLILPQASRYIHVVTEAILGFPIAGQCVKKSPGGCSAYAAFNTEHRHWGIDWPPFGYAMMGRVRLNNFRAAIEDVNTNRVSGSIIELGVWRGGGMLLAAAVNAESSTKRQLHIFDAFSHIENYENTSEFLQVREEDVTQAFHTFDLLDSYVHFHVGLFSQTAPKWNPNELIAVLRIDGNFYDSYQDCMYYMYESVSVGGIVIFDDVLSHGPVLRFWLDFNKEQDLNVDLVNIDLHSAWFRKTKVTVLDWSYFRAPQDVNKQAETMKSRGCPEFVKKKVRNRCHSSWEDTSGE